VSRASSEVRSRIDIFLPKYDFSASYQTLINAPPSTVYECLLHSDFSELWVMRLLMTLRTGKRMPRHRMPGDLRQRLQGTGFVILDEVPDEEIVIGVAGRFWRPDGGRCMELTEADFVDFSREGYAKVAWNFRLRPALPEKGTTILSTETRIQCLGRAARWKFGVYWGLVGPFSGLIRKAILKQMTTKAESQM
jgi:uncharacterized protein YndB with AHSA1/START domain